MTHADRQEPDAPLDVGWATTVASQLGQLSLNADSDLSVSRVCVNVSLFLNIARQWEVDLVDFADVASTEAKNRIQELRATAGTLLEDLEVLVQDVQNWKRPVNDAEEAFKRKVKRTFDTARVKTILAQLQYIEVTVNLIIHVIKLGVLAQTLLIRQEGSEEDKAGWLRGKLYIRSLLMSRQVALKYVRQRLAEEPLPTPVATGSNASESNSRRTSHQPILRASRPLHDDRLDYLDDITYIHDDSHDATQLGYRLVRDLIVKWTTWVDELDDDDETQFEMDEEALAGGHVPEASWSDDPRPNSGSFDLPFRTPGLATMAYNSTRATPASMPRSSEDSRRAREVTNAYVEGISGATDTSGRAEPLPTGRRPSITIDTSQRPTASMETGRTPRSAQQSSRTSTSGPSSARPISATINADFGMYAPPPYTEQSAQDGPQHRRTNSTAGHGASFTARSNRDSGFMSADTAFISSTEPSSDDEGIVDDDDAQRSEQRDRPPSPRFGWRIAVGQRNFDFHNRELLGVRPEDVNSTLQRLYTHDNAVTKIPVQFVTREALRTKGHVADRVDADGMSPALWRLTRALRYVSKLFPLVAYMANSTEGGSVRARHAV